MKEILVKCTMYSASSCPDELYDHSFLVLALGALMASWMPLIIALPLRRPWAWSVVARCRSGGADRGAEGSEFL